ncbi:hypothetical protein B0J13DRAFT_639139 [Dactylonectria estremocensis]|uniref:Cupin type-2 domain-containing protein n=1 Tax=Dactylonectria estremocensis TaxID=1079267 RepID=A0A9P9EMV5_9HYPO|nr:hypothetical protein B0J13DRAFT_639139 [Dactylonectria estremocensis]
MTGSESTQFNNPLPKPNRFITTNNSDGRAVYSKQLTRPVDFWPVGPEDDPAGFGLGYATSSVPVRLTNDQDLAEMTSNYNKRKQSGLVKKGGTIVRYVDYPPKASSPMHRTVSCDYAIVLIGEMECLLDSGDTRLVKPGDILVQRGTMHQWINHNETWARMLYVLLDASLVMDGQVLDESLGDMRGVSASI